MSDQTPPPNENNQPPSNPTALPPATNLDWHDQRRLEREAQREEHRAQRGSNGAAWVGGVVLILLGFIFLLQNVRGVYLNNWCALVSGCVCVLFTATFLFNWNWGVVLPVLLIIWGITLLMNSLLPD